MLDIADSQVKFDSSGDGLARYTIYNYQKNSQNNGYDYKVWSYIAILYHNFQSLNISLWIKGFQ